MFQEIDIHPHHRIYYHPMLNYGGIDFLRWVMKFINILIPLTIFHKKINYYILKTRKIIIFHRNTENFSNYNLLIN